MIICELEGENDKKGQKDVLKIRIVEFKDRYELTGWWKEKTKALAMEPRVALEGTRFFAQVSGRFEELIDFLDRYGIKGMQVMRKAKMLKGTNESRMAEIMGSGSSGRKLEHLAGS